MWFSRNSQSGSQRRRWARRGVVGALALGAPALTGCAAPALLVAANVAGSPGTGSGRAGGANGRWQGYLPKAEDFPKGWDVSLGEVLRAGPAGAASPIESLTLVFGAPPQQCALPEGLYKAQNHPSVNGVKAAEPSGNEMFSKLFTADMHAITVEVGAVDGKESLVETLRGLAARCASFQFTKNSSYDSDFQVQGSIKPVDPKLGFGDSAGVAFSFAPNIGSSYGSSTSSVGEDLGFVETVYAAHIEGVRVVAVSFSFKDSAEDTALVLKLFQETARRVSA